MYAILGIGLFCRGFKATMLQGYVLVGLWCQAYDANCVEKKKERGFSNR